MKVEIKIDENCKDPKIIIVTDKMTNEINDIMKRLSDEQPESVCRNHPRRVYDSSEAL